MTVVLDEATEEFQRAEVARTQGIMQVRVEIHAEDSIILESFWWEVSVESV